MSLRPRFVARKINEDLVRHTGRNDGITEYVAAVLEGKLSPDGLLGLLVRRRFWREKASRRLVHSTVELKKPRDKARPRYSADRRDAKSARLLLLRAYLNDNLPRFGEEGLAQLPRASHFGWISKQVADPESTVCKQLSREGFEDLVGLDRDWRWWRSTLNIKRKSEKKRR